MSATIHPEIFNACEGVAFVMKRERDVLLSEKRDW